jgi:signal transduction histidine kinase
MTQPALSRRENAIMYLMAYAVLVAVAIAGFDLAPTTTARWAAVGVSLAFGLVLARTPGPGSPVWQRHLYLAVQTALTACLMALHPVWTLFAMFFAVLSAQAALLLPPRVSAVWIGIFAAISVGFGLYYWGLPGGVLALPLHGGAYALFSIFALAVARADAARKESQRLLAELQEAHDRLQEYSMRVEELAVVEERNRLAREMHDTLGHRLTVASVQLEGAQRLCSSDPERAQCIVGTVREQVREALGELRQTVAALQIPIEADLELPSALRRLAAHFEKATDLTVHQILPEQVPALPGPHRLAVYRAAQEALTNAQRHADASQVWLVLTVREEAIALLVSDDGKGLSYPAGSAGFGLRGMRERAAQLGGELHVEPRRGGGTQVSFRLPMHTEIRAEGTDAVPSSKETGDRVSA